MIAYVVTDILFWIKNKKLYSFRLIHDFYGIINCVSLVFILKEKDNINLNKKIKGKQMKRIITVLLLFTIVLAGCGKGDKYDKDIDKVYKKQEETNKMLPAFGLKVDKK